MGTTGKQSTSSTGDFHASSPSPWLVSGKGGTTKDIYGRSFRAWSRKLDLVGSSLRTYLASCELPLTTFARTWSASATPLGFGVMKLRLSEHRTGECGCSLWRTPSGQERTRGRLKTGQQVHLSDQVRGLWRTPDAGCARGAQSEERFVKSLKEHRLLTLNDQVAHLFPTPRAADAEKGTRSPEGAMKEASRGHGIDLPCHVQIFPTPTVRGNYNRAGASPGSGNGLETFVKLYPKTATASGSLNPEWVEWLQGLPIGWTDIGQ
jgi:hypothetical protein